MFGPILADLERALFEIMGGEDLMVHFSQVVSEVDWNQNEQGISDDCVAWLKSVDRGDLDFYLANWKKLPSHLNDVDDFSNLVFSTLQFFSGAYQRKILSLQENFALVIEIYQWPGGYLEWFQSISQAVSKNRTGHLTLDDFSIEFLEKFRLWRKKTQKKI